MAVNLSGMCHHRSWSNSGTRRPGQVRWRDWDHHSQRRMKEVTARDAVQRIPDLNPIYDLLKLKSVPNVGLASVQMAWRRLTMSSPFAVSIFFSQLWGLGTARAGRVWKKQEG